MSIKSAPYYWMVCDGCGVSAQDGQEFTAWQDKAGAVASACDAGWLTTEDGRHWCEMSCTTWSDDEDERVPTDAAFAAAGRITA